MKTSYAGINYAGLTSAANMDRSNNTRYGVINQNEVSQAWCDGSEPDYSLSCYHCGADLSLFPGESWDICPKCGKEIDTDMLYDGLEPRAYVYDSNGYFCESGGDGDIFVIHSPYYTYAQFCSPCAPGACYLNNPLVEPIEDNKCYCFGHDWFDDGIAPYDVYDVKTSKIVNTEK